MRPRHFTFFVQNLVSLPVRLTFMLLGVEVKGLHNLDKLDHNKGLILACSHRSQLDSALVGSALRPFSRRTPVYFVSLPAPRYNRFPIGRYFYGGWLFKIMGAYALREGLHDYGKSLATHISLLREGRTVLIYPEGKIVESDADAKAHGGVAYLAQATGAPIIPVAIVGHRKVIFGSPLSFASLDNPTLPPSTRYKSAASKVMANVGELMRI